MDNEIVQRMKAEEADLSKKLSAVREFLAAYGVTDSATSPGENGPATIRASSPAKPGSRPKVSIDGFGEYGRTVVATAMQALVTSNVPLKTRAIVEFLDAMGVKISGENKINAVGAMMARSADIVSHGKAGWSVADPSTAMEIVGKYALYENGASKADAYDAPETAPDAQ